VHKKFCLTQRFQRVSLGTAKIGVFSPISTKEINLKYLIIIINPTNESDLRTTLVTSLIIYMEKLLDSDWPNAVIYQLFDRKITGKPYAFI